MKLCEGGQGREDDEVEGDGVVCAWLFIALLSLIMIYGAVGAEEISYKHWNETVKAETTVHCNAFTAGRWTFSCAHNFDDNTKGIAQNNSLDVAILGLSLATKYTLAENDANAGDEVEIVGAFKDGVCEARKAKIDSLFFQGSCRAVLKVKDFERGISGAPVLRAGFVVGMIVAGIPDNNGGYFKDRCLFVPVSVLREAARQLGAGRDK
jgi:hypothetical protein